MSDIVIPKRIAIPKDPIGGGMSCSEACGYDRETDLLCNDCGLTDLRPSFDGSLFAYFKDGNKEWIDKSEVDRGNLMRGMWEEQMGFNRATYRGGGIRS